MSHCFYAYVPSTNHDKQSVISDIKSLFSENTTITDRIDTNPFTGAEINNLIFDEEYVVTVFYETDDSVIDDKKELGIHPDFETGRIRVLFGGDPNDRFDDIDVIIYDYLTNLEKVVVYSPNQKKVVFNYNEKQQKC